MNVALLQSRKKKRGMGVEGGGVMHKGTVHLAHDPTLQTQVLRGVIRGDKRANKSCCSRM